MKNNNDLQNFINQQKLDAKIISKPSTQATLDACNELKKLGYEVTGEQFIKAIVMVAQMENKEKESIIVMVRGIDKINLEVVKELMQAKKIRIPDPIEAQSICSYERGGTPPVGFSNISTVIIEKNLVMPSKLLFGGGGDTEHLIVIESEELKSFHENNPEVKFLIEDII